MNVRGLLNALALWSAYHGRVSMQLVDVLLSQFNNILRDWQTIKTKCANNADMDNFDFAQFTKSTNKIDFVGDDSDCGKLIQPLISQNADGTEGYIKLPSHRLNLRFRFDQYNFYQECYDKSVFQAPAPPSGKRHKRSVTPIQGVSSVRKNLRTYQQMGSFKGTSDLAQNTAVGCSQKKNLQFLHSDSCEPLLK